MRRRPNRQSDEHRLTERLLRDAEACRPTTDDALLCRIMKEVDRCPATGATPSASAARRRWWTEHRHAAAAVCVAVALLPALVYLISQTRMEGPDTRPFVASTQDDPPSVGSPEAVRALCDVIVETTDTPNQVQQRIQSMSIERQGALALSSARSTANTLVEQLPWSILEESRRRRHARPDGPDPNPH